MDKYILMRKLYMYYKNLHHQRFRLLEFMGKSKLRENIPSSLDKNFYDKAEVIRNKLLMWRFHNLDTPIPTNVHNVHKITSRLRQIITPLLSIVDNKKHQEQIIDFITLYNDELVNDRGFSWEAMVLEAIASLENKGKTQPTVGEIAIEVNTQNFDEERFSARKIGHILSGKLILKTLKGREGYYLNTNINRKKLDYLYGRFGVSVNDVNVVDVIEESNPF